MAKFEIAVLSDQLVARPTLDVMWTAQGSAPEGPGNDHTGYGLGWGVGITDGVRYYAHSGGQQGTTTFIMLVPERNTGIVVLVNMDG